MGHHATLLLAVVVAQSAAQPPAQDQTQPFRAGVQAVEVDVRVIAKDGQFVTDLTADDFQLAEDGVPQRILSAVLVTSAPSAPASTAPPAPPAPALSAPFAPSAPSAPSVWVFVFDTTHLTPGSLQRSRDAIVKFIADRFHDGDVGGIIADGRMANNRLTSNREELRAAAAAVKMPGELRSRQLELHEWPRLQDELEAFRIVNQEREALDAAVRRACADDPDTCRRVPPDMMVMEKAQRMVSGYRNATLQTLSVVDGLSKGLARMAGPKTIVFLSEGFVLQDQESELRQAVGQAARAGAHFYTIDARGLNKGTVAEIIDQPLADVPAGATTRFDAQQDGTNSLAVDTGGFAIRNENNFARALDEIQRDAGTYYVIAYSPTNERFDGKYRSIAVKVKRPDTKVRARRGYLAVDPARLLAVPSVPPPPSASGLPAAAIPSAGDSTPGPVPTSPALTGAAGAPTPETVAPAAPSPDADASAPRGAGAVPAAASPAVRTRVDAGKMALALGKDKAPSSDAAQAGWAAYERGDVETAARELAIAAAAPDAQAWVHYVLGLSDLALHRYRDAAQSWERVRQAAPEFETVYFNLADAYIAQHEDTAAIKVLRDAERRWPNDAEIQNAIGVIQVRRGALDAAIESFERATTLSPDDGLGYFNLGRAHQMRLMKRQRYNPQTQKWMGGDDDRRKAVASFKRYVEIGGPYVQQAKDALTALNWS
jgi:VWFA-related protein